MSKQAKGGNVIPADAAARVEIAEKCALVAVPVPNAKARTKPVKAKTIDDALRELSVSFKVNMRRSDGSTKKEKLQVNELADLEEPGLVSQSEVLKELKRQMEFLHEFQNELQHNPVFIEELRVFMQGEKRAQLLTFLKAWVHALKKPSSQFLDLLRS